MPTRAIGVYIPDPTYAGEPELGGKKARREFKSQLEKQYGLKFKETDIGAGADWPAFVTWIQDNPLEVLLALFLAGQLINGALDGWKGVWKKIASFAKHRPKLDREGASIAAFKAITEKAGKAPKQFLLLRYGYHIGPPDCFDVNDLVENAPPPYAIGDIIQVFEIQTEAHTYRVIVDGIDTKIEELS